jgi:hypothetical protein
MIATIIIMGFLVLAAVLIHYEVLYRLSIFLPEQTAKHRYVVVIGILGALCAHIIEIWLFAFGYYFMVKSGKFGTLQRNFNDTLLDCAYFSFTNYSSLGIGDIEPIGNIRFLSGLEALTGLVLIAWTASFMFVQMQKFWSGSDT